MYVHMQATKAVQLFNSTI